VSVDTIRRWCANGKLPFSQGGASSHRRADLLMLLSGEAPAPRGHARRRLPQMLAAWEEELGDVMPWRPGPLDDADRIAATLVRLRGYSSDAGAGGLIGRLVALAEDLQEAIDRLDREADNHLHLDLDNDLLEMR
jgi:hypothetical protein